MVSIRVFNEDFRKLEVASTIIRDLMVLDDKADTMFADPPDNIKLGYDEYDDRLEAAEYIEFLNELIEFGLQNARTSYISFNAKHMTDMGVLLKAFECIYPDIQVRWLIQGFTFGQHNKNDHGNNFRPIIRITTPESVLRPDAIRRESWRLKNGDKRANPAGKVGGDVFFTDFLEYARVTGNSKQRRNYHPTQLHEGLVHDCLTMTTPEGGTVIDPFMGTGTTLRVCKGNGWNCITTDISSQYCNEVVKEHDLWSHPRGGWVTTIE